MPSQDRQGRKLLHTVSIVANLPITDVEGHYRVWRVEGFERYLIFYRPVGSGIEVVRVLHAARDFPTIFNGVFSFSRLVTKSSR